MKSSNGKLERKHMCMEKDCNATSVRDNVPAAADAKAIIIHNVWMAVRDIPALNRCRQIVNE